MVRTSGLGWTSVSEYLVTLGLLVRAIRWEALGCVGISGGSFAGHKMALVTLGICAYEYK